MEAITLEFKKPFGLQDYDLFLRAKKLPELKLSYDWRHDTYRIETHPRFAAILGMDDVRYQPTVLDLAPYLWDYERFIVRRAIEAKRYAIYADCGMGKTPMFLEYGRHVMHNTGGKVLVFSTTRELITQTQEESQKFYGDELPLEFIPTREALLTWLRDDATTARFAITNYEKMIPGEIPELNYLAGLIADESSIFKTGGGVIKWNTLHSINGKSGMAPAGVEYRLSCTATPAPNDIMEYASQASFLGKLRTDGEILWTFFSRDKRGNWFIKPHAKEAFYRFLASWSIYIRDPKVYGFADNLKDIPAPEWHHDKIAITPEQAEIEIRIRRENSADGGLFGDTRLGVVKRMKLSQIAKGFIYRKDKTAERIPSLKPARIAEVIVDNVAEGLQILVWTVFDEEGEIILEELRRLAPDLAAVNLGGKMKTALRARTVADFRHGELPVLLSKPELLGFGLNFPFVGAMIYSGWDDSYEAFYQSLKRGQRYGRTRPLRVYIPYIPQLEGMILDNIVRKKGNFERDAAEHEAVYRKVIQEMGGAC